jgi:hypothetical protein
VSIIAARTVALTRAQGAVDLLAQISLPKGTSDLVLDVSSDQVYLGEGPGFEAPGGGGYSPGPLFKLAQGRHAFRVSPTDALWVATSNNQAPVPVAILITKD